MHHFLTSAHLLSNIRDLFSKHRTQLLHSLKPSSQRGVFPTFSVGGRFALACLCGTVVCLVGLNL
jgi:hypothetical protein